MSVLNKAGLFAIIQPLTGLATTSVMWEKDPRRMVGSDHAQVFLSLKSMRMHGTDEHRYIYVNNGTPETSTFETDEVGVREFTLTIKCESYDLSIESAELLDSVRTQLHSDLNITALNAISLAVNSMNIATDLPTSYDNRVVNVSVLDIQFNATALFAPAAQVGQGWVDTVNDTNIIPAVPPLSG